MRRLPVILASLAFLVGACGGAAPLAQREEAILAGEETAEWPAVGALAFNADAKWGAYCTGTLIAPQWVLTAAHCADTFPAEKVGFFVGADATALAKGTYYPAGEFFKHPFYSTSNLAYDAALLHLPTPVAGVEPLSPNTVPIALGDPLTMVGYGVYAADGSGSGTGGNLKRKATNAIAALQYIQIKYDPNPQGQAVCFGDSGGPDLMTIGGEVRIVGLHSGVSNLACTGRATSTRVDALRDWIAATLAGAPLAECDLTGGDCGEQACFVATTGHNLCFPGKDLPIGAACDSTATDNFPCQDGAACFDYDEGEVCYAFCRTAADCPPNRDCGLVIQGVTDVGLCLCEDRRPDGSCPECAEDGDCGEGRACAEGTCKEKAGKVVGTCQTGFAATPAPDLPLLALALATLTRRRRP